MCGSHGNECCCCPDAMIFQEEICGNITAPINQTVWTAPTPNDYIQGTFEVTNTGAGDILFSVTSFPPVFTVPAGSSVSVSVNNPANLVVQTTAAGQTGKWCITLYKRVFVTSNVPRI